MLNDNPFGSLLGIATIAYYALVHVNPWVKDDQ